MRVPVSRYVCACMRLNKILRSINIFIIIVNCYQTKKQKTKKKECRFNRTRYLHLGVYIMDLIYFRLHTCPKAFGYSQETRELLAPERRHTNTTKTCCLR